MLLAIRRFLADISRADRGFLFGFQGFPVRVHPFFWLLCVPLAFYGARSVTDVLTGIAVLFVSILVHELGHAHAASRWGVVQGITLHGMGGVTRWRAVLTSPGWRARTFILLAGPAAGFLLAGVAALLVRVAPLPYALWAVAWQLMWVNVAWGVFNLLPIPPLDGGEATFEVLHVVMGARAELWSPAIACVAIAGGMVYSFGIGSTWMLGILVYLALLNGLRLKAWIDAHRRTAWSALPAREQERERYR